MCILSAKYGFLSPDEIVPGPYNECFHNKISNPIQIEDLFLQVESKELDKYEKIIILGGKYYNDLINKIFSKKEICNPLKDCKGIGHMMKRLNELNNDL